jgi:hypothetical protein
MDRVPSPSQFAYYHHIGDEPQLELAPTMIVVWGVVIE